MNIVTPVKSLGILQPSTIDIHILGGGLHRVLPHHDSGWRTLPHLVLTGILPEDGAGASQVDLPDGRIIPFEPGTVLLIPQHFKHRIHNDHRPHTSAWIHWNVTVFQDFDIFFPFRQQVTCFHGNDAQALLSFLKQLSDTQTASILGIVQRQRIGYQILEFLIHHLALAADFQSFQSKKVVWGAMLNYIDLHLAEEIPLAVLAAKRHRSISTLQRDFTADFGITIGHYIRRRRLERVISYLAVPQLTLEGIAEKTGFAGAFSLSRAFKAEFSISPRAYCKEYLNMSL